MHRRKKIIFINPSGIIGCCQRLNNNIAKFVLGQHQSQKIVRRTCDSRRFERIPIFDDSHFFQSTPGVGLYG